MSTHNKYQKIYKRIFDLSICIPAFLVLLPFLLIIACISIISFRSMRVLFIQDRVGYKGVEFKIFKFKTMTDKKGNDGELLPDEERETPWGKFMRHCSLDELPQLINIIRGDMSMIGPRPMMDRYVKDCTPEQRRRFDVKPGVTGLSQILGRNSLTYEERFKYDVWYVKHISFKLDIHILIQTFKVVFGGSGTAYDPRIEDKYRKPCAEPNDYTLRQSTTSLNTSYSNDLRHTSQM